jgi:hypothetical protein
MSAESTLNRMIVQAGSRWGARRPADLLYRSPVQH